MIYFKNLKALKKYSGIANRNIVIICCNRLISKANYFNVILNEVKNPSF